MLNSRNENLDSILKSGQNSSSKYGLGFDTSVRSLKSTSEVKFVPALGKAETETTLTTTVGSPPVKSPKRICYYYGRKGHIRPFCYKLRRDIWYQQQTVYGSQKHNSTFSKWNKSKRSRIWRVKSSENCNIAFTTI